MKVLQSARKFGLLLATVLVVAGAATIAYPSEMRVFHPGCNKSSITWCGAPAERVSLARARAYGVVILLAGLGLGWFSVYRPRRR